MKVITYAQNYCVLVWPFMAFYGLLWPFMLLCGFDIIGLVLSFLAVIDPNSFGLVFRITTTTMSPEEICSLKIDPGNCQNQTTRFYYNVALGQCLEFKYNGCDGNANNFITNLECQNKCLTSQGDNVRRISHNSSLGIF